MSVVNEISMQCRETREAVIIIVNGRGDTVELGMQDYKQIKAELELLRTFAEADEDVKKGRVGFIQETFDGLRESVILYAVVDGRREYKNLV